ncbi:MAG TPA: hypothetical protein VIS31_06350 [Woeseiaceae bacterium]
MAEHEHAVVATDVGPDRVFWQAALLPPPAACPRAEGGPCHDIHVPEGPLRDRAAAQGLQRDRIRRARYAVRLARSGAAHGKANFPLEAFLVLGYHRLKLLRARPGSVTGF